ncbi:S8 family serine peptidase [Sporosarcina sp. FSL K6-1508]|uniref:S8 family serine peptidase n=1 Tax=Sporosarcina sp. FSL K6-1508 TaxID=2921553 RepID=UPI0030F54680
MIKRITLLAVIFVLTFSTAVFAAAGPASFGNKGGGLAPANGMTSVDKIPESLLQPENPEQMVRIIIELTAPPAIEGATMKGRLYKELSESERDNLEKGVIFQQKAMQISLENASPTSLMHENFTTVFNGFSADVKAADIEKIAAIKDVKAVYESNEYKRPEDKPEMIHSKELVQAQRAWNEYGYTGEGMVVGVIDTGIDPAHRDMVLTTPAKGAIKEAGVTRLKRNGSLKGGKYYTEKVPFGYNYMDGNDEILDLGPDASMHGMHVAGTVGANGNEEAGGIKGVAPEAQLLALKVFGNDPLYPSTYGDIYVKAMDDSVKLGADVLNLSLGSTAGFVDGNSPEQQAVERMVENGVLVSISAGNSALYGNGSFYNHVEDQDYGLTGSPSVSYESLGVASFENSMITAYSFAYSLNGKEAGRSLYMLSSDADPAKQGGKEIEIMDAGLGNVSDFAGKDFKGKYALVSRGDIGFVDKALNAQTAGAAGIIIYNNAPGTINMAGDAAIKIPYMSIMQADGVKMSEAAKKGERVTVNFDGEYMNTKNPNAGKMSGFTSWGPTPNLDFKPEITAPGGNIFSTLQNNEYGIMSGTSMASPHVAGGTALVFDRVDSDFGLKGKSRVDLAKQLLMNTAKPVLFDEDYGDYVSPRRQGSGLMQLANALSTDVVATNKATGEAKVALKEIKGNTITFTLEAENFSDESKTYAIDYALQTDVPYELNGVWVTASNELGSHIITDDVTINADRTVAIPANSTASIQVSIDLSGASYLDDYFSNGYFIDGFVLLTDPEEETTGNVPLTVPFFGFKGVWNQSPIFDAFKWEQNSYWGMTVLADEKGQFITGGGNYDPLRFGFSPNEDGFRDKAIPVFSLIRNAKHFEVNVLDNSGVKVRTIRTSNWLRKHYIQNASTNPYTFSQNYAWDGKINGEVAPDGQYYIELRGVIDFEGAEWQSIQFPVKIDTTAPVAKASYDITTKTVTVMELEDNEGGTGIEKWEVLLNDKVISGNPLSAETLTFTVAEDIGPEDILTIRVWDSALNAADFPVEAGAPVVKPVVYITSPENFAAFGENTVTVTGKVESESEIASVTVNGVEAENFDGKNYSHTLTFEDGFQEVKVQATDKYGNEMGIARRVFVDTQAAILTFEDNNVKETKDENVKLKVRVQDNFDDLRMYVNGSEVFAHDLSQPYGMTNFDSVIEVELKLKNGINDFTFEVIDLAGHKTVQKVSITKKPALGNGGQLNDNKKPLPGSDQLQPGIDDSIIISPQPTIEAI